MIYFFYSLYLFVSANASEVVLYPGLKQQISVGSGSVQVEQKGIVTIRDSGRSLTIIGKKIGTTKITTAKTKTLVYVISQKNYRTYSKLLDWSQKKLGPKITITNYLPTIRGKILTFDDWEELQHTMSAEDQLVSDFSVDQKIEQKIRKFLEKLLERHQLPFSDLVTDGPWKMYLSKKQSSESDNYKKILQPLGIQVATSQFVVSDVPMVEISIIAAEVNKRDMSQLGVSWPESTVVQPFAEQLIAKDSWSLTIHHLERNGWGKVLASPTLVTQSGEEATFHSGGEIPIRMATQFNNSVMWKKYGIIMKIKPLVDFKGNIDVVVECEVSLLDGSTVVDGAPGLLINKITSHFNLQDSRTIALSGLIKEQWAKGRAGLPGLKDLPIIGNLFSSQSYLNDRSELMFFVTPKIIK